jgi:hypothetical protein
MTNYAGAALMLFATLGTAIGSYTVNLHVAAERAEVKRLRAELVDQTRGVLGLQAELRTRARLPEMQRWNDNVFKMAAPSATQFLRSPVQLAGFIAPPAPPATAPAPVQYAVAAAPAAVPAALVEVDYRAAPATAQAAGTATLVRAGYDRDAPAADPASRLGATLDSATPPDAR